MARFVFIMLDGAGVGALPDAGDYGDLGSDTLGNLSRVIELRLPFFQSLGLGNILPLIGVPPVDHPLCLPGRIAPRSAGKDTTVGHWEHMGLPTPEPFPTYPAGFPEEILAPFRRQIGRGVLGNVPASGTAIIAALGERHLASGWPIVYTSADSVFQIAAHTDVVPLELLYQWCEIARGLLTGPHAVARVIARPFTGRPGAFVRTKDRRDFSLAPPSPTYLDHLAEAGVPVLALGKISEVFVGRGVTTSLKVASNDENLALLLGLLRGDSPRAQFREGLLFTNLVDFDMAWGHRNDAEGFARGLEVVDKALPAIFAALEPDDRLIISADHGVDPTTPSTDHSREYVPLLLYPRLGSAPEAVYEGGFADTGATIYAHLAGQPPRLAGKAIDGLDPERGWRPYTPTQPPATGTGPAWPGRVGRQEARDGAAWLEQRLGSAPEIALVLGSGLASAAGPLSVSVPYSSVPHWRTSTVVGHPNMLGLGEASGMPMAVLQGRIHGYEGYDLSELQLQVRTLAEWGVRRLLLSNACGALTPALAAGTIVVVSDLLDFNYLPPTGAPARMVATCEHTVEALLKPFGLEGPGAVAGVYAAVPGPQYETPAEVALLRGLGADVVGMSTAAELRAAQDLGLETVVLAVVANAGDTSHDRVLTSMAAAAARLRGVVEATVAYWAPSAR